jgi:FkbM family methyltransferase
VRYHYRIPLKTKLLNIPRSLFQWNVLENLLVSKLSGDYFFWKKLVPPEYLYKKKSWRKVVRNDIRLQLNISNVVDHEIYFNLYDRSFNKFIERFDHANIIWDVGANIGWTVLQFWKQFPNAKIFAFEPSSSNRQRLNENIQLNDATITIVPFGLGDKPGNFKLYAVLDSNPGMNRILEGGENLPFEEIEVIKGDSFWNERGRPKVDILKIDVEGFELAVLNGMKEMIEACKPKTYIEVDESNLVANHTSSIELLKWFLDRGYQLQHLHENTLQPLSFENMPRHFDAIAI